MSMVAGPTVPESRPHPPQPTGTSAADLRCLGAVMLGGAVVLPVMPAVGPLCPLRRVTGVPCPFCGMTTGVTATAHGDLLGAVAANPAAPLLVLAVLLAFVPRLYRSRHLRSVVRTPRPARRVLPWIALPLLWIWELHRYDRI
ncbi:MAG: DUF2752 domain-containing protein [Acidimicrobiales bacterium]